MPRKIAFWATVSDSYAFVFGDWGRLFRASIAWVAIGCIIFVLVLALFGPEALQRARESGMAHRSYGQTVSQLLFLLLAVVAYIAFSVAWHRAVLLGDAHAAPLRALRFRAREFRFLLYLIVITLLSVGVFAGTFVVGLAFTALAVSGQAALSVFHGVPHGTIAIAIAAVLVGMIVLLPFLARFSLGLPAIAVEEPHGVFGRSWHRGWHNGWRLIWGPLICSLPLSIASGVLQVGQAFFAVVAALEMPWRVLGEIGMFLFYAGGAFAHFVALAGAITFLSLSYRQLTQPS
jgi:hypothetical protein